MGVEITIFAQQNVKGHYDILNEDVYFAIKLFYNNKFRMMFPIVLTEFEGKTLKESGYPIGFFESKKIRFQKFLPSEDRTNLLKFINI